MEPFRKTTDQDMEKLLKAVELFRAYDPEMPAQVMSVFLYIASHDDCSKVQLQDQLEGLNMPSASASQGPGQGEPFEYSGPVKESLSRSRLS